MGHEDFLKFLLDDENRHLDDGTVLFNRLEEPCQESPMHRLRLMIVAAAFVAVASPWVAGQDPAKPKDPAPKMRGQLPPNWGKLGLSDEQKQKVYAAQTKYREKIDTLKKQMADLLDQEKKEMEGVLTDAQKSRLREIVSGKVPATDAKPADKP
jgi:hypothetical protein